MTRKPNKTGRMPLSRRLANDIKLDIIRGRYKPGSVLPPIRELVEDCGRSARIPRRALELLAADGWIRPVRGVGSVVLDRGEGANSNGRVLVYFRHTGYSYYNAGMMAALNSRIMAKGYKTFILNVTSRNDALSCRRFEERLKEKWALVVILGGGAEPRRIVAESGLPFVILSSNRLSPRCTAPTCVGNVFSGFRKSLPQFAEACVAAGVKRVVQLKYGNGIFDASELLAERGIAAETVTVGLQSTPQAVAQSALAEMERLLACGSLPDLFLFTDDYLAQGALTALAIAGVRIPEDVKVATHANKGLSPIWPKPLSRFEVDPEANGRAVADAIIAYLEVGEFPHDLDLGGAWIKGESL